MLRINFEKTDAVRCEILKSCCKKLQEQIDYSNIFNEETVSKIEDYSFNFEKIVQFYKSQKEDTEKFNSEYENLFAKAKIYFIHYYKSMAMAIERGELPASITEFYNLKYPFIIPNPLNAEQLIYMSKNLFDCDERRIALGGRHLLNPNIGNVKIWFEKFVEIFQRKKNINCANHAEVENIENIRIEADKLIDKIFIELKEYFSNLESGKQSAMLKSFGFNIEIENQESVTEQLELIIEELPQKTEKKQLKNQIAHSPQLSLFNF